MARPQSEVEEAAPEIDSWIAEQFSKKNHALRACTEGIRIIDRSPLDPLTFPGNRGEKAKNLLHAITKRGSFPIARGHLIMLECSIEELSLRNSLKHKYWPKAELERMRLTRSMQTCLKPESAHAVEPSLRWPER